MIDRLPVKERDRYSFERMLFFSDAVFAISITLLVIDLKIPALAAGYSEGDLAVALAGMTLKFLGFFISFFLIGQTWFEHHRMCSFLVKHDSGLLWGNLWILLFVAFLPFATALMSEYYLSRLAVCLYASVFASLGFAKAFFWRHAMKKRLLAKEVESRQIARISRRVWATPITSGVVIAMTLLGVPYSYAGFMFIPVIAYLLARSAGK